MLQFILKCNEVIPCNGAHTGGLIEERKGTEKGTEESRDWFLGTRVAEEERKRERERNG